MIVILSFLRVWVGVLTSYINKGFPTVCPHTSICCLTKKGDPQEHHICHWLILFQIFRLYIIMIVFVYVLFCWKVLFYILLCEEDLHRHDLLTNPIQFIWNKNCLIKLKLIEVIYFPLTSKPFLSWSRTL